MLTSSVGWVDPTLHVSTTYGVEQVLSDTRLDDKLRRRGMLLLTKTCGACAIIPSSYILQYSLIREGSIHYHGGYADVRKGEYLERPVAVKHLRIREEDSDRAFKVPHDVPSAPTFVNFSSGCVEKS